MEACLTDRKETCGCVMYEPHKGWCTDSQGRRRYSDCPGKYVARDGSARVTTKYGTVAVLKGYKSWFLVGGRGWMNTGGGVGSCYISPSPPAPPGPPPAVGEHVSVSASGAEVPQGRQPVIASRGRFEVTSRDRLYLLLSRLPQRFHAEVAGAFGGRLLTDGRGWLPARALLFFFLSRT